ncbi:serine/threonine-protein kinase pim-2-like [Alosa sapidissima]|uniref:serine/threonine-protein kinase pim-2-like n=1 Tax=Alosa sapidissima TaxID=34773 RepID=UPI001C0A545E|nr:serine/threonine-protein kinase pim-2-like [Alosa sapidissima]
MYCKSIHPIPSGHVKKLSAHMPHKLPCQPCQKSPAISAREERRRKREHRKKSSSGESRWKRCRSKRAEEEEEEEEEEEDRSVDGLLDGALHGAVGSSSESEHTSGSSVKTDSSSQYDLQTLKETSPSTLVRLNSTQRDAFEGKYKQTLCLSQGGYGTVYAGHRVEDSLAVAIKHVPQSKVIRTSVVLDGQLHQFPLEVVLLLMVGAGEGERGPDSSGVSVQLLDWYELGDELVLVMERPLPCLDLFDYIQERGGRLPEEEAKLILKLLVEAMNKVHSKGVLHRDIKPENILVLMGNDSLCVRILDYGCGCILQNEPCTEFYGTMQYTPPEWYLVGEYEAMPSCVWQIGVLLYDMLCGEHPFCTRADIIGREPYIPQQFSRQCQDLMRRCLAKRPRGRPTLDGILQHPWLQ